MGTRGGFRGWVLVEVERFIPGTVVSAGADALRRARLVVLFALAIALWGPVFAAVHFTVGDPRLAGAVLLAAACALAVPWLLRWTGSMVLAGHVLLSVVVGIVTVMALFGGGILVPGLSWNATAPLMALLVLGRRSAIVWTILPVVVIAAFYGAQTAGIELPGQFDESGEPLRALVAFSALVILMCMMGVMFETTESAMRRQLVRAGRSLAEARDEAEAATKAKSQFLANVSHEIRTPIHGLLGAVDLLSGRDLNAGDRQLVETIQNCGAALRDIVNDVLDLAKIESGRMELDPQPTDLRKILRGAVDLLRVRSEEKGLALEIEIDPSFPEAVSFDEHRFRQVVLNLVGNAVKFTERGRVRVDLSWLGEGLRLEVRDTGVGFAPELQEKLFEPFTQADPGTTRRYGGTGLGLAITRNLVRMMGAELEVESRRGEGTMFGFECPVQRIDPRTAVPEVPPGTVGARVLLVDDNPANRLVGQKLIERLGLEVHVAEGGRQALEMLNDGGWDLMFLDCQMPGLDGFEVTRRLRGNEVASGRRRLPVVAMTAGAMAGDRERCLEAGMDDYVPKPIRQGELERVLGRFLASRSRG